MPTKYIGSTNPPTVWKPEEVHFLLILRDLLNMPFKDCADGMKRQFVRKFTPQMCRGQYHRAKKNKIELPQEIVDEVKGP